MRQDQCQQILSSITCNYKNNTLVVNFSVLYGMTERVNIIIGTRDNVMHDYVISDQFIGAIISCMEPIRRLHLFCDFVPINDPFLVTTFY